MKAALKALLNFAALVAVLPLVACYHVGALCCGSECCFAGFSQCLSLAPGKLGVYLRRAAYRCVLPRVGPDACVSFGVLLTSPRTELGRAAYIGPYSMLGDVTIEDDVLIAAHVSIINGGRQHGFDDLDLPMREQGGALPRVTIGAGSWLGERAVVMCDVGRGCVVGAGAIVTRPLPDYAVAVGVPARIVRYRGGHEPLSDGLKDERELELAHSGGLSK
jgi:acetyltransferase-like isoleucine patch superfamily enzyme